MPRTNELPATQQTIEGVTKVEVTDLSNPSETVEVTTTTYKLGGLAAAAAEFTDQAVKVTPVEVEAHECEGGAAVCGHRGFSLIDPETGTKVLDQPFSGVVNEREQ